METFLKYEFLFLFGGFIGYILELLFSRIVNKVWVNPGFFAGPYVPIYGFCIILATLLYKINLSIIILSIICGLLIDLIELIGGIILKRKMNVRLWDYSDFFCNYKGYICLEFTLIWIFGSLIYYKFFINLIIDLMNRVLLINNISFILGIILGLFLIDVLYSFDILMKIKNNAQKNNIIVKYEELKIRIKNRKEKNREKYSFIFPFKSNIENYFNNDKNDKSK